MTNPIPAPHSLTCIEMATRMLQAGAEATPETIALLRDQCAITQNQWSPQTWWMLGTSDNPVVRQVTVLDYQGQPISANEHAQRVGAAFSFGLPRLIGQRATQEHPQAQRADAWVQRFDFPILPDSRLERGLDKHKTLLPAWRKRKRHEARAHKLATLFNTPGPRKLEESVKGVRTLPKDFPQRLVDELVKAALKATRWPVVEALLPFKPSSECLGEGLLDVALSNPRAGHDAPVLLQALLDAGADANPPCIGGFFFTRSDCPAWAWEAVKGTLDPQLCLDEWSKQYNIAGADAGMRVRLDELICQLPIDTEFAWKQTWQGWPSSHRPRGSQRELEQSLSAAGPAASRPRM